MRTRHQSRPAFTVLELLVVIATIAVLIGLLLPAIQQAREQARRIQCVNNLVQIGIALQSYQQTYSVLPPGSVNSTGPVSAQVPGYKMSWIAQILPHMGEENAYRQINFGDPNRSFLNTEELAEFDAVVAEYAAEQQEAQPVPQVESGFDVINEPTLRYDPDGVGIPGADKVYFDDPAFIGSQVGMPVVAFSWLRCPSSPAGPGTSGPSQSDYAGCHNGDAKPIHVDNDGLLYLNSAESLHAVPDGTSTTLLVGEKLQQALDHGWMTGDESTLRNCGFTLTTTYAAPTAWGYAPPYSPEQNYDDADAEAGSPTPPPSGFASYHTIISNFLFADGSVRAVNNRIAVDVLKRLGSRNDGSLISTSEF